MDLDQLHEIHREENIGVALIDDQSQDDDVVMMNGCEVLALWLVWLFVAFPMILMIWNCQGAALTNLMRSLKNFIGIHKPNILGLLEPKVSGVHVDNICRRIGYDEWVRMEAVGFSGGIWVFLEEVLQSQYQSFPPPVPIP